MSDNAAFLILIGIICTAVVALAFIGALRVRWGRRRP